MRFEDKYIVSNIEKERVLTNLKPFVVSSNMYKVSTLYYDTPNLQSYYEKLSGDYIKKKYRKRSYNDRYSHFEIKEKINNMNAKHRLEGLSFLSDGRMLRDSRYLEDIGELNLFPTLHIEYIRTAYEFQLNEERLRLTIDSNIKWGKYKHAMYPINFQNELVLELKFRELNYLTKKAKTSIKIKQVSFSKYERGMKCFIG